MLRNVVRVDEIVDPVAVVEQIVKRTDQETLSKIYSIPSEWSSTIEFLTMLALTSGKLLKGGTPDILTASRTVLHDWNGNKIPYFSVPPSVHPSSIPSTNPAPGAENVGEATIVSSWGEKFELAGLFESADQSAWAEDKMEEENELEKDGMDEDG